MVIVSTGKTLASSEFYNKKLQARRKKLLIISGIVIVILVSAVFVLRWDKLRIATINVSGAEIISPELVTVSASEILSGYYLWVIPKDNILFYPRRRLLTEIETLYPRFGSIEISLSGFTTLDVVVSELEPFALYCGEVSGVEEMSNCYFLDSDGLIFDRAPSFSTGVYFVYASDTVSGDPLGQEFLSALEFKSLVTFVESLSKLGFKPVSLELISGEFHTSFANQGKLLWLRSSSLDDVYSNLESFLAESSIKTTPNFFTRIEELDLRTEDKVFYRFNDE